MRTNLYKFAKEKYFNGYSATRSVQEIKKINIWKVHGVPQ